MKKKVLISACLLGKNCRYDGGHSHISELDDLDIDWVSICPEEEGDLGTPRPAAEMRNNAESILKGNGSVINKDGKITFLTRLFEEKEFKEMIAVIEDLLY